MIRLRVQGSHQPTLTSGPSPLPVQSWDVRIHLCTRQPPVRGVQQGQVMAYPRRLASSRPMEQQPEIRAQHGAALGQVTPCIPPDEGSATISRCTLCSAASVRGCSLLTHGQSDGWRACSPRAQQLDAAHGITRAQRSESTVPAGPFALCSGQGRFWGLGDRV